MNGKKTMRKWYSELPEPYKSEAIRSHTDYFGKKTKHAESLLLALLNGFEWGETEQGYEYWENIYNELT